MNSLPLLHTLMQHKEDRKDPNIPLLLWLAYEQHVTGQQRPTLDWLKQNAADNPMVAEEIVPRTMRRLAATNKAEDIEACVAFVEGVTKEVRHQALDGLAQGLKGRQVDAPPSWKRVFRGIAQAIPTAEPRNWRAAWPSISRIVKPSPAPWRSPGIQARV